MSDCYDLRLETFILNGLTQKSYKRIQNLLTFLYLLVAKSLANIERYLLYTYVVETVVVMVIVVLKTVGYLRLYVIELSNEGMLHPVHEHLRADNHHKNWKQCLQMT